MSQAKSKWDSKVNAAAEILLARGYREWKPNVMWFEHADRVFQRRVENLEGALLYFISVGLYDNRRIVLNGSIGLQFEVVLYHLGLPDAGITVATSCPATAEEVTRVEEWILALYDCYGFEPDRHNN